MPKSKQDWANEGKALEDLLKQARTKTFNCAIVMTKDGMAIETDLRLPTDKLWLKARKAEGATPKGLQGKLSVNGIMIQIQCEEPPPDVMELKFKQYLQLVGLKFKPEFILPGGAPAPVAPAEDAAGADLPQSPFVEPEAAVSAEAATGQPPATDDSTVAGAEQPAEGPPPLTEEARKSRGEGLAALETRIDELLAAMG